MSIPSYTLAKSSEIMHRIVFVTGDTYVTIEKHDKINGMVHTTKNSVDVAKDMWQQYVNGGYQRIR